MSKEAMRHESERLGREAMARNVIITQGKTRLDVKCSKCGAPNRVSAEVDHGRVEYACKKCGHNQKTCDQRPGGSLVTVGRTTSVGRLQGDRPARRPLAVVTHGCLLRMTVEPPFLPSTQRLLLAARDLPRKAKALSGRLPGRRGGSYRPRFQHYQ